MDAEGQAQPLSNDRHNVSSTTSNWMFYFWKGLQCFHFLIAVTFLWAGLVEFINNPPYFDAYGDAQSRNELPSGLFQNDPRQTQESMLRLMDLPILATLVGYFLVSLWLRFRGPSWLLTGCLILTFLCFCLVNFWAQGRFAWKYFSSRMSGLELQVSTLALSATMVFMVLFERRKRMPFKFKSSLRIKKMGACHIIWNFVAIYFIMFTSMLLWFTKLYSSWACFNSHSEILRICQITDEVQCIPCNECHTKALRQCFADAKQKTFACSASFPGKKVEGAFCIFNYNMGVYRFLTIFAYIGGLCVFLSTFLGIVGHYILRALFLITNWSRSLGKRSNQYLVRKINRQPRHSDVRARPGQLPDRELLSPGAEDIVIIDGPAEETSDSEEEYGSWINASCG